jgi:hypothetical protein
MEARIVVLERSNPEKESRVTTAAMEFMPGVAEQLTPFHWHGFELLFQFVVELMALLATNLAMSRMILSCALFSCACRDDDDGSVVAMDMSTNKIKNSSKHNMEEVVESRISLTMAARVLIPLQIQ